MIDCMDCLEKGSEREEKYQYLSLDHLIFAGAINHVVALVFLFDVMKS